MAKFELSISSKYVDSWGVYEGVRELIQNAIDAQQDGHAMTVSHKAGMLTVFSEGVHLDRSVLLLGVTSKAGGGYRGHFGEGLKLGALALARAGRRLVVVNDDESWIFKLQPSAAFGGVSVLTVSTRTQSVAAGGFSVQVELTANEWSEMRRNFLFLDDTINALPVPQGAVTETALLLDPEQRGRCYVKGIFVEERENLAAGYDFHFAETDRDRRMVRGCDFEYYAGRAWGLAYRDGLIEPSRYLNILASNNADTLKAGTYVTLRSDQVEVLVQCFKDRYGDKAIPVESPAEAAQAEHLGRYGIICNRRLIAFFTEYECAKEMTLAGLGSSRRTDIIQVYDTGNLSDLEQKTLHWVNHLVECAAQACGFQSTRNRVSIVDFGCPEVLGISAAPDYRPDLQPNRQSGARGLFISRSRLASPRDYLAVLVHELAHDRGSDGDVGHRDAESSLYVAIVASFAGFSLLEYQTAPSPEPVAA